MKIAIFDFCETLADFQTADAYIEYLIEKRNFPEARKRQAVYILLKKTYILKILTRLFKRSSINKRLILWRVKGISEQTMEELAYSYYTDKIRPHLIDATMMKMRQLKESGYRIYLASGGYGIYLKHFLKEYDLDGMACTKIQFKAGFCCGNFYGTDCIGEEKVRIAERQLGLRESDETIFFSDSRTDLPLLLWCKRGVVVSRGRHQEWADLYELEELIWDA